MKVNRDELAYITNVVDTARMVGIDDVIIEPDKVRAIDENKTVVLFQDQDVPEMSFNSIGLNRINVFLSRLDVARTQPNFEVNATTDDDSEFARSLTMKAKGVKVEYRCANPRTIAAPKKVNDTLVCKINLTADAVYLLQKGLAAMGGEVITVVSDEYGVTFKITDINNDEFTHTFTDQVELLSEDANVTFTHNYPAKILLSLFKTDPEGYFCIGQKGMLNIVVNNLNIFVLPQVSV